MAGFELTWIGADRTALEVGTRAGLDLGVLQAGLLAAYGFDAPLRDASTELRLARHRLGVFAGIPLRMTRRSSFEALLDAGVAALERNSVNLTDPNVMPTAARTTWSALFGVEVALVHRFAGAVGVRVHAGLDVLPGAPRYLYEDLRDGVTTTTERKGAQRLQPRAGVMVFASF